METPTIYFYAVSAPYGEFSNFALYPIRLKGQTWPTSEHYFQAQKFTDATYRNKIRKARSPMKAAEMGRSRRIRIRPNWDHMRDQVMYEALKAKFSQHPELKALLLSTGDHRLVEHTTLDSYWGDGGNGKGQNKLGKLLMRLRTSLQG